MSHWWALPIIYKSKSTRLLFGTRTTQIFQHDQRQALSMSSVAAKLSCVDVLNQGVDLACSTDPSNLHVALRLR